MADIAEATREFVERVRAVARDCGYAVAVHGSMARDLDLVAVPWTVEAISAQGLVDALCDILVLTPRVDEDPPQPEMKPWGRLGWSLHGAGTGHVYVDLSVAPRAGEAVPLADGTR